MDSDYHDHDEEGDQEPEDTGLRNQCLSTHEVLDRLGDALGQTSSDTELSLGDVVDVLDKLNELVIILQLIVPMLQTRWLLLSRLLQRIFRLRVMKVWTVSMRMNP